MFNKIVLIGVGLIGGSFALSLKRAGCRAQVVGWERSPSALARALELGIIDQPPARWQKRWLMPIWCCWPHR